MDAGRRSDRCRRRSRVRSEPWRSKGDDAAGPAGEQCDAALLRRSDPDYKLWIRLKADANYWGNDSVWVQFSGATDLAGTPRSKSEPILRLRSISRSAWVAASPGGAGKTTGGVRSTRTACCCAFLRTDRDPQSIVIQTREDGVSIDPIVLSAATYLDAEAGTGEERYDDITFDGSAAMIERRDDWSTCRPAFIACAWSSDPAYPPRVASRPRQGRRKRVVGDQGWRVGCDDQGELLALEARQEELQRHVQEPAPPGACTSGACTQPCQTYIARR